MWDGRQWLLPTLHIRVKSDAAGLSSEKPMARLRCEEPEAQLHPLYRLIRPRSAPICAIATIHVRYEKKNVFELFDVFVPLEGMAPTFLVVSQV